MIYLLLIISLIGAIAKNVLPKLSGKRCSQRKGLMLVNMLTGIIGMIVFGFAGISIGVMTDVRLILMAIGYGVFTLGAQTFYMAAVERGSVSVCSLIYASSFMIPTVVSIMLFGENCSLLKATGILMMLVALALVSLKNNVNNVNNKSSFIFIILSTLSAGGMGILQKVYARIYGSFGRNEYLFMAFWVMLIIAFIIRVMSKEEEVDNAISNKKFYIIAVAIALCTVMVNNLNLILIAALPALVFFPVYNGGTVLCSALSSRVIFNEKLSKTQWLGILLGAMAIVMTVL